MLPHETFIQLCDAKEFIYDCYSEPITLEEIADIADFSRWHLLRLFRDAFGQTPHELLTELRIRKARELLTITSRSVTDICFDVGFTSLGSFSTLFRKFVGVSPQQFRNQVRTTILVPGQIPNIFVPMCFFKRFAPCEIKRAS